MKTQSQAIKLQILQRKIELKRKKLILEARDNFFVYRQLINPKDKWGWFNREVCDELQEFAEAFKREERPKLVIEAPPQHGKSVAIIDFISWMAGRDPDKKTIYGSFSERLGIRCNLKLQRIYSSPVYQEIFPEVKLSTGKKDDTTTKNRDLIEYAGREGYFRNTTVRGSVTGESLDLGVIDDPLKGRAEANSPTTREAAWDWFTDDFFTRFSEDAGLLIILTRWHIDDPVGRLLERMPNGVRVLKYKAIAEQDEFTLSGKLKRKAGEPLFPEHKSLEFLLERKAAMSEGNWLALYQQSPTIIGGNLFKTEWWQWYNEPPPLAYRIVVVDTAQKTAETNDWSVLACWGMTIPTKVDGVLVPGKAVKLDMLRGKWEAPELLAMARAFWQKHSNQPKQFGVLRTMYIEDKVSGTGLIQTLKRERIPVVAIQRDKDKVTRANDVAPQLAAGNVMLPKYAPWLKDFLEECAQFPNGVFDDQVDTMMDAVEKLTYGKSQGIFG